ncbi:MAG TPA: GNAT family N-acetyltransferase [Dehalococcoidia bacterium]|nr:GNAT family N-acetyltransferase [Dehalococcoidia bacterium]
MTLSSRPHIREARSEDGDGVFCFCQNTWEWGDYIPQVWDRWLAEPRGKLLVAILGGQPVALDHVVMVSPEEAWLEGLRVDPAYRRAGLATLMARRCLKEAKGLGARVARFATSSLNMPIHILAAHLGFSRVAALGLWRAEATPVKSTMPSRPSAQALAPLLSFLQGSAALAAMGGLYSSGWRFKSLSPDELKGTLERWAVRQVNLPGGAVALATVEPGHPGEGLVVSYADGSPAVLTELALGLRAEAADLGLPLVSARLPDVPPVQEAFRKAGYEPAGEGAFWIYQRVLRPSAGGESRPSVRSRTGRA